jgi:hypothetical protein
MSIGLTMSDNPPGPKLEQKMCPFCAEEVSTTLAEM